MNWKDVTVWQWQQIQNLLVKREGLTELDIAVKSLEILTYQTEAQIDSLSIKELNEQLKKITFITESAPIPKPNDIIKIGKKRYRCVYDIRNIPYSRYLETKFFGDDIINNLHKIAASMVMPMKLTWRGWKVKEELTKNGMDKLEAEVTIMALCNVMDGFTRLPSLPNTRE